MEFVMAEMPFWPVQAIACAVIGIVLFLLGRYLYRGPRRRRTAGGLDAFVFVGGLLLLAMVAAIAVNGEGFGWGRALAGLAAVLSGVVLHRRTRRSA